MLDVEGLKVQVAGEDIIKGIDLVINVGEVHALMGPNGSGKSTFAQALMGNPIYTVTSGSVLLDGNYLLDAEPNERSNLGLFLSFQYPSEIEGVKVASYLRMIYNKNHSTKLSPVKFRELLGEKMDLLEMDGGFMNRYLNDGFSGGEKKRMEMLQMLILEPKLAILDEVDSGLDVDALKVVGKAVDYLHKEKNMTILLITHYTRILKYIKPEHVHIMKGGAITKSGDEGLAHELEESGYAPFGE